MPSAMVSAGDALGDHEAFQAGDGEEEVVLAVHRVLPGVLEHAEVLGEQRHHAGRPGNVADQQGDAEQLAQVDAEQCQRDADERQRGVAAADLGEREADDGADGDGGVADLVLGALDEQAVDHGGDQCGGDARDDTETRVAGRRGPDGGRRGVGAGVEAAGRGAALLRVHVRGGRVRLLRRGGLLRLLRRLRRLLGVRILAARLLRRVVGAAHDCSPGDGSGVRSAGQVTRDDASMPRCER
ncbi:hypothetical protein SCOCK_120192 [Actinacidiphila cocklensis]|uniref:Uncharacterized protein n=1 Tax=Actinacidiphila cocklensis TaxID=887465 RepID=A0A9W4GQG8_9ACTN|nr:hypothetical protein SCOCK_120192 [Actinacidiphila cocklensis]